jgi:polyisoprenoid-binding protein YceI
MCVAPGRRVRTRFVPRAEETMSAANERGHDEETTTMRLKTLTIAALAGLIVLPHIALATTYEIDPVHSGVEFSIRHLVAKTPGRFNDFAGTIEYDPAAPGEGKVSVVIQAASIDTRNEDRDKHLRSADFFDVEKYPEITYEGAVTRTTDDGFEVTGMLAMHGVTREVVLPVELLGIGPDPWGNERAGFYAELELNRKDFDITWNKTIDQGGLLLGDDVTIRLAVEAVKTGDQAKQ